MYRASCRAGRFNKVITSSCASQNSIRSMQLSIVPNLPWSNCKKKMDKARRNRSSARTSDGIVALDLEAAELLEQLRKIRDAVHAGSPAPRLRLVSDTE